MSLIIMIMSCLATVYGNLPPNIFEPKCPRKSPQAGSCLIKTYERLRPYLPEGIPEYNIPRLEPFKMRELNLDTEVPGFTLKGSVTNIDIYGVSKMIIKKIKIDFNTHHLEFNLFTPKLSVTADYDTTGSNVYTIDISDTGHFKGEFYNITSTIKINGYVNKRNGLDHFKLDYLTCDTKFGNSKLQVDPDAQTEAAQTAALFVKTSANKITNVLTPIIDLAAAPIIKRYITKVLNVLPLNKLFRA